MTLEAIEKRAALVQRIAAIEQFVSTAPLDWNGEPHGPTCAQLTHPGGYMEPPDPCTCFGPDVKTLLSELRALRSSNEELRKALGALHDMGMTGIALEQWEQSAAKDAEAGTPWSAHPRAVLAVLAVVQAARSLLADEPKTFWLIERGQSMGKAPTVWKSGTGWTTDVLKAQQFATREDCERVIDTMSPAGHAHVAVATEHAWAALSSLMSRNDDQDRPDRGRRRRAPCTCFGPDVKTLLSELRALRSSNEELRKALGALHDMGMTGIALEQWEQSAAKDAEAGTPWSAHPRAVLAVLAVVQAARSLLADEPKTFWLIERGQSMGKAPTVWKSGTGWTTDVLKAQQFATREDCERVIDTMSPAGHAHVAVATEHAWGGSLLADEPER